MSKSTSTELAEKVETHSDTNLLSDVVAFDMLLDKNKDYKNLYVIKVIDNTTEDIKVYAYFFADHLFTNCKDKLEHNECIEKYVAKILAIKIGCTIPTFLLYRKLIKTDYEIVGIETFSKWPPQLNIHEREAWENFIKGRIDNSFYLTDWTLQML